MRESIGNIGTLGLLFVFKFRSVKRAFKRDPMEGFPLLDAFLKPFLGPYFGDLIKNVPRFLGLSKALSLVVRATFIETVLWGLEGT